MWGRGEGVVVLVPVSACCWVFADNDCWAAVAAAARSTAKALNTFLPGAFDLHTYVSTTVYITHINCSSVFESRSCCQNGRVWLSQIELHWVSTHSTGK